MLAVEEIRDFLNTKLLESETGDPPQVKIKRQEIESVGEDPYTTLQLLGVYNESLGYWFVTYEDFDENDDWKSQRVTHVAS